MIISCGYSKQMYIVYLLSQLTNIAYKLWTIVNYYCFGSCILHMANALNLKLASDTKQTSRSLKCKSFCNYHILHLLLFLIIKLWSHVILHTAVLQTPTMTDTQPTLPRPQGGTKTQTSKCDGSSTTVKY